MRQAAVIRSPGDVTTTETATAGNRPRSGPGPPGRDDRPAARRRARSRVPSRRGLADEVHQYAFAVGPDMPVYLWWSRVGAAEGLSLVGERPGMPALIPTIASALGIGLVPAVAGVQYALMPASALAAAALARGRGETPRLAWLAGGGPGRRMDDLPGRRLPREPRARRRFPRRRRRPSPAARGAEPSPRDAARRRRPRAPGVLPGRGRRARRDRRVVVVGRPRSTERASIGRPSRRGPRPRRARGGVAIVLGGILACSGRPRSVPGTPRSTRCSDGRGNGRSSVACTSIASSGTGGDTPRS